MKIFSGFILLILCVTWAQANEKFKESEPSYTRSVAQSSAGQPLALEPTHYFYVPKAEVLNHREFVLSFHEWAIGIDRGLQVFISPFSSIGGIFLGGKYSLAPSTAVCLGLASGWYWRNRWTVVENNGHVHVYDYVYEHSSTGLGAFLAHDISENSTLTGNLRLWDGYLRLGVGLGHNKPLGEFTQLILEAQGSFGTGRDGYNDGNLEGAVGIRYTVPTLKPLQISAGIALDQWFYDPDSNLDFWPYIDLSYSSRF